MRKILTVFLAMTFVLTMVLPATDTGYAAEAESGTTGITYTIEGTTMYIKGTGPMEDFSRPDDTNVPWRNERSNAAGVEKIVIQEGITHIGDYALARFSVVQSVSIPSSVKSIGKRAFQLSAVTSISLPSSVTAIGQGAFQDCINLTSVTTEGLQGAIPKNAFSGCTNLKSVSLNEGITAVETYAFSNTEALQTVTLPASVKKVEPKAFDAEVDLTCKDSKMVKYGQNAYRYLQKVEYDVYRNYEYAYDVLALVNEERKKEGLASLTLDASLMESAMERAGELVILFSHTRPNSGSCETINSYICGENAAVGQASPETVVEGWMRSPGHRQNILMKSWTTLGVGCIVYEGTYYWIQCFGMESSGNHMEKPANQTVSQITAFSVDAFQYQDSLHQMQDITLSPEIRVDNTEMKPGASQTASIYMTKSNAGSSEVKVKNTGVTWSSSNINVATVSSSGIIHAIGPGETTIIANMSHYTLQLVIYVSCVENHTYKQASITPASYEKNGEIKYECSLCGATEVSKIYKIKSTKLSASALTYNGKVRKPTVKVMNSKGEVISSKYYTVTYEKGRKKVGKYKVTVKFTDRYEGTAELSFKINPAKTYIASLDGRKKAIQVKWKKKTTQNSGYQIRYSTSSSFKSKYTKTVKVKGAKKSYKTIKGLKANKKYYVKVRTYKVVNGKTFYSAWSKKKMVRTD